MSEIVDAVDAVKRLDSARDRPSLIHTSSGPCTVSTFAYRYSCWLSLGDLDHHESTLWPRPQHEDPLELLQPIVDALGHCFGRPACHLLLTLETAVERRRRRTCMQ